MRIVLQYFVLGLLSLGLFTSCGNKSHADGGTEAAAADDVTANAKSNTTPKADVILHVEGYGNVGLKLYDETPKHKESFLSLVKKGFYDGQTFHRIIRGFMLQGGDPYSKDPNKQHMLGQGGPGYRVPAEILPGYIHSRGILSAAREGDQINPKRESGSQFFIVTGMPLNDIILNKMEHAIDSINQSTGFKYTDDERTLYKKVGGAPWLDQQYTVFGEVAYGMDIIAQVEKVNTTPGIDRPIEDIRFSMTIAE